MRVMKKNSVWRHSIILFAVTALVSCVTVNVNFPESAVQKASDDYVKDLYREKEQGKSDSATPTPKPVTQHTNGRSFSLISAAVAGEVFTMNSPKSEEIKGRLKARVSEIIEQKRSGILGETNDGLLTIHEPAKLKAIQAKHIKDLVKDENADRNALYEEIVVSNKLLTTHIDKVKDSFSHSFQAESPSGTWLQGADGAWSQKK